MSVSVKTAEIEAARSGVDDIWSAGNAALYRLCAESPSHSNARDVIAKLWLIGRAYSAAIERRPTSKEETKVPIDEYYRRAATVLADSRVDEELALLSDSGPRTVGELVPALRAHAAVVVALRKLSGTHQRSFASKYLHFHSPSWFFILDTDALRGLGRLGVVAEDDAALGEVGDSKYRVFVARAWTLRSTLAGVAGPPLTPRQLDRLLLKRGA